MIHFFVTVSVATLHVNDAHVVFIHIIPLILDALHNKSICKVFQSYLLVIALH